MTIKILLVGGTVVSSQLCPVAGLLTLHSQFPQAATPMCTSPGAASALRSLHLSLPSCQDCKSFEAQQRREIH